ncbi:hypothetical protein [Salinibacterium sp. ZJ454]|uniref:hypothetical protein n=1 Tax=Salinibacterium sp. ZJ454 TaxID=2708339 RepID=UPI001420CF7F|nr:hypothetical protein [Salinibacterium sp. ZJ454]
MGTVLRIYLDQNKWIDLARAATGHSQGARFVGALARARASVAEGAASFPLDIYRYLETGKRRDGRSRNDVVDIMLELSQQHTMARPQDLLATEINRALMPRYGCRADPRLPQVFGTGLRHITAGAVTWPAFDSSRLPPGEATASPDAIAKLEQIYDRLVEGALFRMGPDTVRAAGFDPAESDFGQRYVNFENQIAAEIAQRGLSGELLEVAVRASDLGGIRTAVTEALERINLAWEDFVEGTTPVDLMSFMGDLPTATSRMSCAPPNFGRPSRNGS